ncbi:ZNF451 isoform 13 [Pan troglodytes]|uniref:Zinc finger protein 451 n=2 Tax=Homininae TaxID=207598 RepID=D6RB93_HUMAN|nr:zinc finger protein 451 [Homo sapiens]KAI4018758.1 zinc finger protein 451 [Homo sapiens]PNI77805.1 ZNF451 isoform 13 [Pan troglodytes]
MGDPGSELALRHLSQQRMKMKTTFSLSVKDHYDLFLNTLIWSAVMMKSLAPLILMRILNVKTILIIRRIKLL